jgi:hypothetical protein
MTVVKLAVPNSAYVQALEDLLTHDGAQRVFPTERPTCGWKASG